MIHNRLRPLLSTLVLGGLLHPVAGAQGQEAVTPPPEDAPPASQPERRSNAVSISGVLFLNYQYRTHPREPGANNRFDVERAYLTARARLDPRSSIRLTTDVFQVDTGQRSWAIRVKYAWLHYDYLRRNDWNAGARLGLIQTVFIEHDEQFWPRWLSSTPTDRHGFFSSADAGIGSEVQLPGGRGEIYSTITNGPGFGSREVDRFKDFATRLTLRPFAPDSGSPLRTLALSVWGYKGAIASRFVRGGPEQLGPVGSHLARDRWGIFAAIAEPRFTLAAQHARRIDEGESGANTVDSPRVVHDSTGSVSSAYAIVRPFGAPGAGLGRLAGVARFDRATTNRAADRGEGYDFGIAGVIFDLSPAASLALDFQAQRPRGAAVPRARTYFVHFVARF